MKVELAYIVRIYFASDTFKCAVKLVLSLMCSVLLAKNKQDKNLLWSSFMSENNSKIQDYYNTAQLGTRRSVSETAQKIVSNFFL